MRFRLENELHLQSAFAGDRLRTMRPRPGRTRAHAAAVYRKGRGFQSIRKPFQEAVTGHLLCPTRQRNTGGETKGSHYAPALVSADSFRSSSVPLAPLHGRISSEIFPGLSSRTGWAVTAPLAKSLSGEYDRACVENWRGCRSLLQRSCDLGQAVPPVSLDYGADLDDRSGSKVLNPNFDTGKGHPPALGISETNKPDSPRWSGWERR